MLDYLNKELTVGDKVVFSNGGSFFTKAKVIKINKKKIKVSYIRLVKIAFTNESKSQLVEKDILPKLVIKIS